MSNIEVHNVNVGSQDVLITPEQLKLALPMSNTVTETVAESRQIIQNILDGKDHRIFVVVGPCSIHDTKAAMEYAARLRELPFNVGRLKTGTPPRIAGSSVDWQRLARQPGDDPAPRFSFLGEPTPRAPQVCCWITRTNARTHEIIRAALHRSPLFGGAIQGVGPRYCPSVEDKVVRFADRESHQIFVEPEGLESDEIYPNGISTSLPYDVQVQFVRSIEGFESAHITRPGYAIEYDYFDPRDLTPSLASKHLPGLWLAGQINGTTGYEEAAAQGLLAGLNAARDAAAKAPWWPRRDEAYLGVLVDDLITHRLPLDEIARGFQLVVDGGRALKVIIRP